MAEFRNFNLHACIAQIINLILQKRMNLTITIKILIVEITRDMDILPGSVVPLAMFHCSLSWLQFL